MKIISTVVHVFDRHFDHILYCKYIVVYNPLASKYTAQHQPALYYELRLGKNDSNDTERRRKKCNIEFIREIIIENTILR